MSGHGRYIVDAVVLEHRSPTQVRTSPSACNVPQKKTDQEVE